MEDFYLVCVYTPNSQNAEEKGGMPRRLDYRMKWEDDFQAYLHSLDKKKPVIVCGDMNVAHEEIDIKNPKSNHKNAGFTDAERGKMTDLLNNGFTDTFRTLYPEQVTYSWWSYRFHAREKNAGWRIDYFLISDRLRNNLVDAKILTDIMGSDHCPVELDLSPTPSLPKEGSK
jgi:exodeoxyribonuclease-3